MDNHIAVDPKFDFCAMYCTAQKGTLAITAGFALAARAWQMACMCTTPTATR